jgi:hypothetical protein
LDGDCIIDQAFQPRLPDGMIRCHMGLDKVVGFRHQLIKALVPPPPEGPDAPSAQPGPRIMHPVTAPEFRALRLKMEDEWVPQVMQLFGLDRDALPIIWDADFLYGPRNAVGDDTFVLGEIVVSWCFRYRSRRRRQSRSSQRNAWRHTGPYAASNRGQT